MHSSFSACEEHCKGVRQIAGWRHTDAVHRLPIMRQRGRDHFGIAWHDGFDRIGERVRCRTEWPAAVRRTDCATAKPGRLRARFATRRRNSDLPIRRLCRGVPPPAFRKLSRTAREPFCHPLRMTAERHFHSRRSDGRQKRRLAAGDPAGRGREGRARDRGIGRRAQLRVRRRPPPVQSSSSAASMTGRSCAASVNISVNWSSAVRVSRPVRVIR